MAQHMIVPCSNCKAEIDFGELDAPDASLIIEHGNRVGCRACGSLTMLEMGTYSMNPHGGQIAKFTPATGSSAG